MIWAFRKQMSRLLLGPPAYELLAPIVVTPFIFMLDGCAESRIVSILFLVSEIILSRLQLDINLVLDFILKLFDFQSTIIIMDLSAINTGVIKDSNSAIRMLVMLVISNIQLLQLVDNNQHIHSDIINTVVAEDELYQVVQVLIVEDVVQEEVALVLDILVFVVEGKLADYAIGWMNLFDSEVEFEFEVQIDGDSCGVEIGQSGGVIESV
ncbi:MAG: hypothetical protein EZS28_048065, partial [Streblomastix strix]